MYGLEVDWPDLFADRHDHEAQSRRERASHWASAKLGHTSMAQEDSLHLQRRSDQGRNVLGDNFSCDIQPTKCASFDQVAWIVETTRVDREHFVFTDIHI